MSEYLKALGWSDVRGGGTCLEVPGGEQRCFRTGIVRGFGPEQTFATRQGCVKINNTSCFTSPSHNEGNIWCCPPGWPKAPGDTRQPGEFPPAPPGLSNKFVFYSQYWWFWAMAFAVPVVGYLGYKTLTRDQVLELSAGADLGVAGLEAADVL